MLVWKHKFDAVLIELDKWKRLWREASRDYLWVRDELRDCQLDRVRLAMRNDQLAKQLARAHFRDPNTGRLLPVGQLPQIEGN